MSQDEARAETAQARADQTGLALRTALDADPDIRRARYVSQRMEVGSQMRAIVQADYANRVHGLREYTEWLQAVKALIDAGETAYGPLNAIEATPARSQVVWIRHVIVPVIITLVFAIPAALIVRVCAFILRGVL